MSEFERIAFEKGWMLDKTTKEAQTPEELRKSFEAYMERAGKPIPEAGPEYDSAFQDYLSETDQFEGKETQTFEAEPIDAQEILQKQMKKELTAKVQAFIHKATGMPVSDPSGKFLGGPDGTWGPMSAAAWNAMLDRYITPDGAQINPAVPDELPSMDDIHYIFSHPLPPKSEEKPAAAQVEEAVADDMIVPASIMSELVSLANETNN
jgi:hypothetical protein